MANADNSRTGETVSQTLENVLAGCIGNIQAIIDRGPGLEYGEPERLARLVNMARALEGEVQDLADDVADELDGKAEDMLDGMDVRMPS